MWRPKYRLLVVAAAAGALACADPTGDSGERWLSISAGAFHTCAIAPDHRAWCWGRNEFGALGDGTTDDRAAPVPVGGNLFFDSISAGYEYSCGLDTGGHAYCWGANFGGQLGDGSATNRLRPVRVDAPELLSAISAGEAHTCARGQSGQSWCWGAALAAASNGSIPPDQHTPAALPGPAFVELSSGYEIACALDAVGAPWCWGLRVPGVRFSDTTQLSTNTPAAVDANGLLLTQIGAGSKHACGLTAAGAAWCWGINVAGQLGDGSFTPSLEPREVLGGHVFTTLSAHSPAHACALTADGTAWCWGGGALGSLGNGANAASPVPVSVSGGHQFASIATGFSHSCGITLAGEAYCWGYGGLGQLGTSDTSDVAVPTRVATRP